MLFGDGEIRFHPESGCVQSPGRKRKFLFFENSHGETTRALADGLRFALGVAVLGTLHDVD